MAKVWVGAGLRPLMDDWDNPRVDAIRERAEPFRDAQGRVVPPGMLGRYFEVVDRRGAWHPVHPDDIRPFESVIRDAGGTLPKEEVARIYSPYTVRVGRGGWWMEGLIDTRKAIRTDAQGRFSIKGPADSPGWGKVHFASGDWTLQALHRLELADFDRPIEVTLRPTRLVRARAIETPVDHPRDWMDWRFAPVDASGRLAAEWQQGMAYDPDNHDPDHMTRHLTARVPPGRWRVSFRSATVDRSVDVDISPGDGPLDLPDFEVLSRASHLMVGRPAAEIDAVDLTGRPVRLADFRGRVVVLDFWSTTNISALVLPKFGQIAARFRDRPLTVLAVHDASIATADDYRRAVEPIRREHWGGVDPPVPVLLDRRPAAPGAWRGPGGHGYGSTGTRYEPSQQQAAFVIGADGRFVGEFDLGKLEAALDDQFGMPHAAPASPPPSPPAEPPPSRRDVAVSGRVVGPDGQGIVGAKLFPQQAVVRQRDLATGPGGYFAFEAERVSDLFSVRVEPPSGLAKRMFRLDVAGPQRDPLVLGVGVEVAGRVVRDGRPVAGLPVGLSQIEANRHDDGFLGFPATTTDRDGRFRFEHAFADQELILGVQIGHLKGGETVPPVSFRGGGDGSAVDLGDLAIVPGRRLGGRVAFADGKAIPPGTTVVASVEEANARKVGRVDPGTGRFDLDGLPDAEIHVVVVFPDIRTHLPDGYRLSPSMPCVSPLSPYLMAGRLDRDVLDMTILLEPGDPPRLTLDPTRLADFDEARAATLVGAPPGATPPPR